MYIYIYIYNTCLKIISRKFIRLEYTQQAISQLSCHYCPIKIFFDVDI